MNHAGSQHLLVRRTVRVPLSAQVLLAAVLVMSLGVFVPVPLVRALLVLPIALLAPGFAIVVATSGSGRRLDAVPALALSALLSMATYPLLALLLYAAGLPLSTASVVGGVDGIILLLTAVIVLRTSMRVPAAESLVSNVEAAAAADTVWSGTRGALLFVSIITGVIAALALEMRLLPTPAAAPYTQFYLTGPWSHINSIVHAQPGRPLVVNIGMTNGTERQQTYHIVPLLDDNATWRSYRVTIAARHSWRGAVSGYVPTSGCVHRLNITMRASRSRTVLGSLTLWVRGAPGVPPSCPTGQTARGTP